MSTYLRLLSGVCVIVALASLADAHGMMTIPRLRGALKCPTRNIQPKELTPNAPVDYCPHCANAGGRWNVKNNGGGHQWRPYKPMTGDKRGGFGLCGDPAGQYDHGKHGKYGNPKSFPYSAVFKPGSVANFEFDATANHGGYLEFYLCDVSQMPYNDISFEGFPQRCHHLKRVAHGSCESGHDRDCGPIDHKFPERWVLPCGNAGGDTGDQILGGSNGKMAYQIPDVHIEQGVLQMYWLTQNDCTDPEGFMENYNYPQAWSGCHGDGGSIGGKPQHHKKCGEPGFFPEEFWNCADVQVKHLGHGESNPNEKYGHGYGGHSHGGSHHGNGNHHGGNHGNHNNHGQKYGHHGDQKHGNHNNHKHEKHDSGYSSNDNHSRASNGGSRSWFYSWSWSSKDGYKSHSSSNGQGKTDHGHNGNNGGSHHGHHHSGQTFHHVAEKKHVVQDGNCIKNYKFGCDNLRCCKESFSCRNNQCKE